MVGVEVIMDVDMALREMCKGRQGWNRMKGRAEQEGHPSANVRIRCDAGRGTEVKSKLKSVQQVDAGNIQYLVPVVGDSKRTPIQEKSVFR